MTELADYLAANNMEETERLSRSLCARVCVLICDLQLVGRLALIVTVLIVTDVLRGQEAPLGSGSRNQEAESSERQHVLNVREFGATGDGQLHFVSEWITSGRFRDLGALRAKYPYVTSLEWTLDEVAFAEARRSLPPAGGVIYFPEGHYVAGAGSWTIMRDNVTLRGDGAAKTTLSTGPKVAEGLVLSPYRHGGWLTGTRHELPLMPDAGEKGASVVSIRDKIGVDRIPPGELVFIRGGANRFDQDYGEFNEVVGHGLDGRIQLRYPLARSYTLPAIKGGGHTTEAFQIPAVAETTHVAVTMADTFHLPRPGDALSIGEAMFRVVSVAPRRLEIANPGRGNPAPGTLLPKESPISRARAVVRLTQTTRGFRAEGLTLIGRRKVVNISNSYDVAFRDCVFIRDMTRGGFSGGLTLDGDGGRFARLERCTFIARPAMGMQIARSFGNIVFDECRFVDTDVAFTEFSFQGEVRNCEFQVTGNRDLTSALIVGQSCNDLLVMENRIRAIGVVAAVDGLKDVQAYWRGPGEGNVVLERNTITKPAAVEAWRWSRSMRPVLQDNRIEVALP